MKALKCIISSSIFITIAVIVGCSDNFTSPVTTENKKEHSTRFEREATYTTQLTLGVDETIVLDSKVTLLDIIISYDISDCRVGPKGNLFISSSSFGGTMSLPCGMRVPNILEFHDLSIRNISGQKQSIKVTLIGK